jgi:squalene-associated FAD-dependent desaturase
VNAPRDVNRPCDVVVIGGGLAGLTAACAFAEAGIRVTVLESRHRLGGATYSFLREGRGGEVFTVDNGQHVVLACYERYLALLSRLGSIDRLRFQPRLRIPVLAPGRRPAVLAAGRLPAPVHMLIALARFGLLTPSQRLRAVRAARALAGLDPADPAVDQRALGDWLRENGQDAATRDAFWRLLCEASLNIDLDRASLALAAMIVRTAFVASGRGGARIGLPDCSLTQLHVEPAARYLAVRGAVVVTRRAARAILPGTNPPGTNGPETNVPETNGWQVTTDDGAIRCRAVVLAVPPTAAARLLPRHALAAPLQPQALGSSPIVSVHLHFDRRVLDTAFVAAVDAGVPWVFDRTRQLERAKGQYVTVPISASQQWVGRPGSDIVRRTLDAVRTVLPAARDAQVRNAFVTRQRHATFRQSSGCAALRPPTRTALPGLVLAGAWTDTGWPDTMEGAVRSGEAAAAEVLELLDGRRHDAPTSTPFAWGGQQR